jgi:hypothetical protein
MMKYVTIFLAIISVMAARADQRHFVWTYEYQIMEQGKSEFEQYTSFKSTDADNLDKTTSTELNFELEIGMNSFFDFAIYQVFTQSPDQGMKYSGFKLRSRFKIGEKGQFFVDPLVYIEYKGVPGFSEHEIETKLILARDFGDFNISFNPYFELAKEAGEDEWEFEPKYAAGATYKISNLFNVGIESTGSEDGIYLGPTISHGSHNLWISTGALFGIGKIETGKPEFQVRMIFGVEL